MFGRYGETEKTLRQTDTKKDTDRNTDEGTDTENALRDIQTITEIQILSYIQHDI